MKHVKIFEDFEEKRSYSVNFDTDSGGVNHLVMFTADENAHGVYGDSFRSSGAANREIQKYMKMGYEVVYFGPDLEYAQEIVD